MVYERYERQLTRVARTIQGWDYSVQLGVSNLKGRESCASNTS